jgi:multiple sugar transport system permease protein
MEITETARVERRPVSLVRSGGVHARRTILTTTLALILVTVFLWPFLCALGHSFNRMDALMDTIWFVPKVFSTQAYELMVTRYHFDRYILNSLYVVTVSTALSVFACSLAGYALAKCEFAGRNVLFLLIVYIMLLPSETMLVSRFVVMKQLNLVNNYWGLILPAVGGNAYGIFLMRQFMLQVPTEMLEAARIDGASEFGLFLRVVVPIMIAPIGVLSTLTLRGQWNALLWPQILITDEDKMLLMPAIGRLKDLNVDPYSRPVILAAALTAASLPLAVYAYNQRFFVATLTGAIKG